MIATTLSGLADAAHHNDPTGAGFDLLLLAHVACVIVGLGAVVASGVQALRVLALGPSGPVSAGLRRYFAPGVNWVGRVLFGVPLFGFLLIAASGTAFSVGDEWIVIGLVLWGVIAVLAEAVLWPAERRVQAVLAREDGAAGAARSAAMRLAVIGGVVVVLLLSATVLMVAQP
jgi:hypothetical protein